MLSELFEVYERMPNLQIIRVEGAGDDPRLHHISMAFQQLANERQRAISQQQQTAQHKTEVRSRERTGERQRLVVSPWFFIYIVSHLCSLLQHAQTKYLASFTSCCCCLGWRYIFLYVTLLSVSLSVSCLVSSLWLYLSVPLSLSLQGVILCLYVSISHPPSSRG